jgi:hypothetical protein
VLGTGKVSGRAGEEDAPMGDRRNSMRLSYVDEGEMGRVYYMTCRRFVISHKILIYHTLQNIITTPYRLTHNVGVERPLISITTIF